MRPTNGPVHPRACGEHVSGLWRLDDNPGSSPRMRGTRADGYAIVNEYRFIPAHAGNTLTKAQKPSPSPVHPRACGEHGSNPRKPYPGFGSSPACGGTQFSLQGSDRFIPAHAGNTQVLELIDTLYPVHPRACGEHNRTALNPQTLAGSSPRMRGTQACKFRRGFRYRFIPAHAGNTRHQQLGNRLPAVHPRACGEHWVGFRVNPTPIGSSPRMRGTLPFAANHAIAGSSPRMRGPWRLR